MLPNCIKHLGKELLMVVSCVNPGCNNTTLRDAAPLWSSQVSSTGGSVAPCLGSLVWNHLLGVYYFVSLSLFLSVSCSCLFFILSLLTCRSLAPSLNRSYFLTLSFCISLFFVQHSCGCWGSSKEGEVSTVSFTHSSLPKVSWVFSNPEEIIVVIKSIVITSQRDECWASLAPSLRAVLQIMLLSKCSIWCLV